MCHIALVQMECGAEQALSDFLTSLCKVYGSEAGTHSADLGMQVMGGYGYLTEYGMEQIWRDARICAIYEGANGIHSKGMGTRGVRSGGADAFEALLAEIATGPLDPLLLERWHTLKERAAMAEDPSSFAHAFYQATSALFQNAIWQKIRTVADHHPEPARIKALASVVLGVS
jgi:hypothetical protein